MDDVLVINGWVPGMNKVALTKRLRAGGIPLATAARMTGRVLDGHAVRVRVSGFSSPDQARELFAGLGLTIVAIHAP